MPHQSLKNPINLLAEYLESKHQTFCAVRHMLPKRMHMAWRDTTNSVDSGVLAMRHMESYTGQDCNEWNCGLQRGNAEQVLNLCKRFMHNILLSEVNSHMHTIANCVGQANRESMEMLTNRTVELKVAKSTVRGKDTQITITDFGDEEPSSDVSAENLRVEWSAKHL
nr:uncharacterized protein LOC109149952 [Ipomoea batatas]GME09072.1 uncharacterized protein LOC109149952 [Ipomoea batatas]